MKWRLLSPVTALRRWRRASRADPFTRTVYETHHYRPAMRRFFLDTADNRDILVDVELPEGAVVLDVGAFVGEWSKRILQRADARGRSDIRIHAFEPEPSAIKELLAGVGEDPRLHLHPVGLAGRDRLEQLALGGPGSSVFVDSAAPGFFGTREIELRDVEAVLSSLEVDHIDLIKINIEGGEYELLDRLHETGWLPRVGTVIVQFHEFAPDAYRARRRNRRQLAETHRCTWSYPWVFERWDRR